MTATLLLIRHGSHRLLGHTLCGRSGDVRLSQEGEAEARALGARLAAEFGPAAIYASPQPRTRQTAEILAEACRAPVHEDQRLDEVDFGAWSGSAFAELSSDPRWRRWNEDRGRARAPGGESLLETQARMARFLDFIAVRHPGDTVAAVSHADVIKSALTHVLGLPLHFYDRFDVSPASVSAVGVGEEGQKVLSLNETLR